MRNISYDLQRCRSYTIANCLMTGEAKQSLSIAPPIRVFSYTDVSKAASTVSPLNGQKSHLADCCQEFIAEKMTIPQLATSEDVQKYLNWELVAAEINPDAVLLTFRNKKLTTEQGEATLETIHLIRKLIPEAALITFTSPTWPKETMITLLFGQSAAVQITERLSDKRRQITISGHTPDFFCMRVEEYISAY